jgi:hypothetical protein
MGVAHPKGPKETDLGVSVKEFIGLNVRKMSELKCAVLLLEN